MDKDSQRKQERVTCVANSEKLPIIPLLFCSTQFLITKLLKERIQIYDSPRQAQGARERKRKI